MGPTLEQLNKITIASSYDFCLQALIYLQNFIRTHRSRNMATFIVELNEQTRRLVKMQPNMAGLKKKMALVIYTFKRTAKTRKSVDEIKKYVIEKIQELIDLGIQKKEKIAIAGAKLITPGSRIVTIGYSSMVEEICLTAHTQRRKFEIWCLESAPTGEGRMLAENLAGRGLTAALTSDAAMGTVLQQSTFVLAGSNRIYEDSFVNKMGSLPLAVMAKSLNSPFYLAAETDKILRESELAVRFYDRAPAEIYSPRHKSIGILNRYYEAVPLDLVTKFITEDGVFDPVEFKNWYLKD